LFAQEEVFCGEGKTGAQTEEQKALSITHKREQETSEPHPVAELSDTSGHHNQGIPLRHGL
jgi:hypothetical protein